ncbi:MAG: Rieske (2Fe-2S) protein [Candidatus Eremiobacteraeota bacterium]|nr:Rieske (2Fe-2S) protein [Candidatus Eremiobacteraeota bacterium]
MNAQNQILVALAVASAGSLGFIAAYALRAGSHYEGLAFAVSAAALSYAAAVWARLLPVERVTDPIESYPSPREERQQSSLELETDLAAVTRYKVLRRWLSVAISLFAVSVVVPLRSLGPAPGRALFGTKWRRGDRIAREDGSLIRVNDMNVDSTLTVFPEHAVGDAQSQAVLIRLPVELTPQTGGYIAYSRLCTHAGCPVALYRASVKQLFCPCHQSAFDVTNDGAVVAGPADHALPRLPIAIGEDGFVHATGDFPEPVGPGFWERG